MKIKEIFKFIKKQKTAVITSIDENGYPATRAMLTPRIIEAKYLYFSTNTSSNKVNQYLKNKKACVYFYKKGKIKYQGVMIKGSMEVCQDAITKERVWRFGDSLFYKQGVTDPDYCVLKFECQEMEYYCDLKIEHISLV